MGRVKRIMSSIRKIKCQERTQKQLTTQYMGIKIRKRIHQGQENPIEIKKDTPRSRKGCHDQEKFNKSKRTLQRYNPKDSGN